LPLKNDKKYTSVELFAGAGGLALGLEKAGFAHALLVEHDKHAAATLRQNRPFWYVIENDVEVVMDRGIKTYLSTKASIDMLSGGYPCQAFSYAGKKLGLNDTRGTLFYSFAQALAQLKPRVFLAKNVRGLFSHDGGNTLATMLNVFKNEGYAVQYKVLNAVDFSTAQKRERLVIVGIRNDLASKAVYYFPQPHVHKLTLRDVLHNVPVCDYPPYSAKKTAVLAMVPRGAVGKTCQLKLLKSIWAKAFTQGADAPAWLDA
jgi:DNA (cytosine-5)-methyltransferase 1